MVAALVGMLGAIAGLLVSNLLQVLLDRKRRRERMEDVLIAICAKIHAGGAAVARQLGAEERDYLIAQAAGQQIPFGPADETDFVFDSIKSDLSILPVQVLFEVVRYYKLAARTNLLTNDLRHPDFKAQSPDEMEKYVRSLLSVMGEQQAAAQAALSAIEDYCSRNSIDLPAAVAKVVAEIRQAE